MRLQQSHRENSVDVQKRKRRNLRKPVSIMYLLFSMDLTFLTAEIGKKSRKEEKAAPAVVG